MKTIDQTTKQFIQVLHETDTVKRIAVYHAVAEVVVGLLVNETIGVDKDYEARLRMAIKNRIDRIGELAIIDRVLLETIMVNTLKFKLNKLEITRLMADLYTFKSFEDILGLSTYYSKINIDAINTNLALFKDTIFITHNNKSMFMD